MALIAEYGFSEGSGTTTADTSGNGRNLTLYGGSPWGSGKTGGGVIGDGTTTNGFRGSLGTGTTTTWTVMLWFYRTGSKGATGQFVYSNAFWFEIGADDCAAFQASAKSGTIPLNTWTHIACVSSGTSQAMYINGTQVATTYSPYNTLDWGATWEIPGQSDDGNPLGILDDVRFFDTALSAGEIAAWMNSPLGRGALVAEYLFPEGSGTTSADSSGNGYNLTIGTGQWQTGYSGYGIQSNTQNDTPYTGNLGTGVLTNYTWMFWVYRTGTVGSWGQVIYDSANFWFELSNTNVLSVNVGIQTPPLDLNTWTHIALTRSGNTYTFFVNGSSVSTVTTPNSDYDLDRSRPWCIGTGGDGPFPGVMDEVRLFDTALSAAEITTWMNTPVGGVTIPLNWVAGING